MKVNDFNKVVDDEFWKHITTSTTYNDVINWDDIDKKQFLAKLSSAIFNHEHHFKSPEYIYFSKDNGILRRVKAYNVQDTCTYYYCVKNIQTDLTSIIKSVDNIYGGFRLSPDLQIKPEDLEKLKFDPEYESFAKNNYRKEWSEYQNLARRLSENHFDYYIHIDIAHFYDDINIDLLENKLKNAITNQSKVLDILFYFLRNSDKKDLGYISNDTGLPQEEVGEMSRLLANFYLHEFDNGISKKINQVIDGKTNVFTRYADDMWIAFKGEKNDAYRIIQVISAELLKIKLHINEKKLRIYTQPEFDKHWHFETWDKINLISKNPKLSLTYLNKLFKDGTGRWFSPFIYILKSFLSNEENVSLITSLKAGLFLDMLLDTPTIIFKSKDIPVDFFKAFFTKFPALTKSIQGILKENKIIHPSQEFFIINLLSFCCLPKAEIFELLYNQYFQSVKKYYQWYSRVLCINFFLENLSFLKGNTDYRKKLIEHLRNSSERHNYIERRYNIKILHSLSTYTKAEKVLKEVYVDAADKAFLQYIKDAD